MALAERAGLPDLVAEHVLPAGACGVNAHLKVGCLVAGVADGADSIDDMGMLRYGAMGTLFGRVRAPSTLARTCAPTPGERPAAGEDRAEFLARLARQTPLLTGADALAFIDIDSM